MRPKAKPPVSDQEIASQGFAALLESLGPSGAFRFIRICESGGPIKDYTKERHRWLDKLTFEDIAESARKRGADRGLELPEPTAKPKMRRPAAARSNPKSKEGRP